MSPQALCETLRQQPFQPFRIAVSSGAAFPVRHPELCILMRRWLIVAWEENGKEGDHYALVAYEHITHLEPLPAATPGAGEPGI